MANSYDALVAADGATFDYSMGDASGHLTDLIGGANTTSETGITYGVKGLPEVPYTAVDFDGTTSIAQTATGANAGRDFADGPFSIELWVKFADNGVSRIPIDRGHTVGNGWMIQKGSDNTIRLVDSSGGTTIVRSAALTDLTGIHHIVATKTGATSKMYLDGVDVSIAGTNVTLTDSTDGLAIGRSPGFSFFKGTIYRATGYNLVLSAAQVATHFAAGHAAGYTTPVARVPNPRVGPRALRHRWHQPYLRPADVVVAAAPFDPSAGGLDWTDVETPRAADAWSPAGLVDTLGIDTSAPFITYDIQPDTSMQELGLRQTWFAADPEASPALPPTVPFLPGAGFDWSEQPQAWWAPLSFAPDAEARPPIFPKAAPANVTVVQVDDDLSTIEWDWPAGLAPEDRLTIHARPDGAGGWAQTIGISPNPSYQAAAHDSRTQTLGFVTDSGAFFDVFLTVRSGSAAEYGIDPVASAGSPDPDVGNGYPSAVVRVTLVRPAIFTAPDLSMQEAGLRQAWFAPDAEALVQLQAAPFDAALFPHDGIEAPRAPEPWNAGGLVDALSIDTTNVGVFELQDGSGQQDRAIGPTWFTPDLPTETPFPPTTATFNAATFPFDAEAPPRPPAIWEPAALLDTLGIDTATPFPTFDLLDASGQQDRAIGPSWFAPEPEAQPLIAIAAPFDPSPYSGLWTEQPAVWRADAWFTPDLAEPPFYVTLPPVTDVSTPSTRAPLWIEQPAAWQQPPWYNAAVEPVDGPLQSWLFTTGSPGSTPRILIDATNGDVYLWIGGNLMVPAS